MKQWCCYPWIILIFMSLIIAGCGNDRHSDLWGSGILEATEVTVSSLSNGLILEITPREGESVTKGDIVALIDTTDLRLQLEGLTAQLDEIEAVSRGIRISAARTQEELELARLTAERTKSLFDQGSVTQQVYDETQTRSKVAELSVREIRNKGDELSARRANVKNAMEQLRKKIADAVIRTPSSGIVIHRLHEPGEVIRYGERLLTIAQVDTMQLKIYLKEDVLSRVSLLAEARIRVDALGDETLPGVIRWIASEAEFTPKNVVTRESRAGLVYAVNIDVPNPNHILKIGMPAEAEILE